jgi:hypothetical protein
MDILIWLLIGLVAGAIAGSRARKRSDELAGYPVSGFSHIISRTIARTSRISESTEAPTLPRTDSIDQQRQI